MLSHNSNSASPAGIALAQYVQRQRDEAAAAEFAANRRVVLTCAAQLKIETAELREIARRLLYDTAGGLFALDEVIAAIESVSDTLRTWRASPAENAARRERAATDNASTATLTRT